MSRKLSPKIINWLEVNVPGKPWIESFELFKREFPDNYGLREGLRIDAIDLKDRYDDDIDFNEELLDELRIYYKNKTIVIKRYDRDDWEIEDEDYLRFVDFEKIGKILSIVMKHLGRIELDWFATILGIESKGEKR